MGRTDANQIYSEIAIRRSSKSQSDHVKDRASPVYVVIQRAIEYADLLSSADTRHRPAAAYVPSQEHAVLADSVTGLAIPLRHGLALTDGDGDF